MVIEAGMDTMVRHDWCHEKIQFATAARDQLEPYAPSPLLLWRVPVYRRRRSTGPLPAIRRGSMPT
jgi:hypothetical protein